MPGWVKLHRDILGWEWFTDSCTLKLFIYLIVIANHIDGKYKGVDIKKGQCALSQDAICRETGLSRQQVRTAMEHLKTTGEITIKTTNKYSIVTICNYDKYQADEMKEQPIEQPTSNQQVTNNQPTSQEKEKKNQEKNKETLKNEENERIFNIETKSPNGDISKENQEPFQDDSFLTSPEPEKPKQKKAFVVPSLNEVRIYFQNKGYKSSPDMFYDHFESNGWMVGKNKMKNWQSAANNWERNDKNYGVYNRQRQDRCGETPAPDWRGVTKEQMGF